MKKQQLLKIINNGGATLDKNGRAVNFKCGYQVSVIDGYTIEIGNARKILQAVESLLNGIERGSYVGIWIENGEAFIDISKHITSKAQAIELGRSNGQISIYDWQRGRCVYL